MSKYKNYNTLFQKSLKFILIHSVIVVLVTFCLIFSSCFNPLTPVDSAEEERVKAELNDRSFRQFAPSVNALKRKGVILDFFESENKKIRLWAQYSEGNTALYEWEIFAENYRIEKAGSVYRIYFEEPESQQNFPNKCNDCIETSGISISIRNLFESDKMRFKLNDNDDILPLPFPVFNSWTSFNEDEYFE